MRSARHLPIQTSRSALIETVVMAILLGFCALVILCQLARAAVRFEHWEWVIR